MDKKDRCPLLMANIVDRDSNKCSRDTLASSPPYLTLQSKNAQKYAAKKCSGGFADIETYGDLAFEKASAGG